MPQPGDGAFDLPVASIAAQFAPVLRYGSSAALSMRTDQFDPPGGQMLAKAVTIVGAVSDQAHHALPRPPAASTRHRDRFQRLGREPDFGRRGRTEANSQRNTFAVSHHHAL